MAPPVTDRYLELDPARPLFHFVGDDGRTERTLTAGQLAEASEALARGLVEQGLRPGDRVLLAHLPSLDVVVAVAAALRIGLIAAPVPPPNPADLERDLPRFAAMAHSCGAVAILSHRPYLRARAVAQARGMVRRLFGRARVYWPDLPWHATDQLRGTATLPTRVVRSGDVALLQYTSGSTATPRGVRITHGNLAHQLACNAEDLGLDAEARCVMWLPHFHDFGLISGICSVLAGNGSLTMLSPLTFLRRPESWIEALSRSRATHTAAPNFAYDLVVRKTTPARRAGWDLSALRVAMSAAEPVHDSVVRAFCDAFAISGMRAEAFCPAYGLAEHTVGVSVGGRGRLRVARRELEAGRVRPVEDDGPGSRTLVGCGRPSRDVVVRIVDPETRATLPAGRVGEIWVDSPSKADGYWGLPDLGGATFEARVADPTDGRGYLRTGDLGFLHEGEVYVTGRLKDLIIVRGRNLHPQDLEASVRWAHPSIRPGGVAAFSVERPGADEELVVLLETREPPSAADAERVATQVRRRLAADHQVACGTVLVGGPGVVRKTTSGKVQRRACRDAWQAGELTVHAVAGGREGVAEVPVVEEVAVDPRFDVDPAFRALIVRAARYLGSARGEKAPGGVGLRGELVCEPAPEVPPTALFRTGRVVPALLRHDNRTSEDDLAPDARVAGLRLLESERPDEPLLDLPLLTGRCFFHRTAADFLRYSVASPEEREASLRAEPHRIEAAWEGICLGGSYTTFRYHSQTARHFVADDGTSWFARYRLRDPARTDEVPPVDRGGQLFPPSGAPRPPGQEGSPTALRDELLARVAAGGVRYVLEVQLRRADEADEDELLDATRPWSEPWRSLGQLRLDTVLDPAIVAGLSLNPAVAPVGHGVVWARSATSSASIDHVRSVLYEVAAAARLGRPLPAELAAWLAPDEPPAQRIAVVGAGASGLTLARALERRGARVTVIEREATVGGMCRTEVIDGVTCDLGGHMIFRSLYPTITALAEEHGQRLIPDFPDAEVSLATGRVTPPTRPPEEVVARVARLVAASGARSPGLVSTHPSLFVPIARWLEEEDLGEVWRWMGPVFVGAGYGHLEDEVPAAYLARSFAHTHDAADRFQLERGFEALWTSVAERLADVRVGTAVVGCRRSERGVELTLRGPGGERTERFDQLVVAHAPSGAGWLDADEEERDLFGRVRHLRYVSAFAEVDGLPEELRERWCFVPEHTSDGRSRGHVLSFVQLDRHRPIVGFICYEGPNGPDEAAVREDFARLGGTLRRVVRWHPWSYFPHFSSEDLASGVLDRFEGLQGRRSTWHASTALSFELTECAAAYAEALAERIVARPGASVPVGTPSAAAPEPATTFAAFRRLVDAERARVLAWLQDLVQEETGVRPGPEEPLADVGVDSLRAAVLHRRVGEEAEVELDPSLFFHATARQLADHLVVRVVAPELALAVAPVEPEPALAAVDTATEDLLRQLEA
ncbi:MAG: AMP-binding protein [Alphaproteobacteria bacterium]|nr:AMP-binding protein [Alphaproteobacteria bacterium]MCB9698117.1 AMP-binding protein [Alphaproteobacteria bacterium]